MTILYQDDWIVACNKATGELCQGTTLQDENIPEPARGLYPINRLDRPVSGLVLYGKTAGAADRFGDLFRSRECLKVYMAVVSCLPEPRQGTLTHWLISCSGNNRSRLFVQPHPEAKKAVLQYRHIGSTERYHFLEIVLETGRHHQIRAQLAAIGCPVKGDLKYGAPRSNRGGGISLHARLLRLTHPHTGKDLTLTAPYPEGDPLWPLAPEVMTIDDSP